MPDDKRCPLCPAEPFPCGDCGWPSGHCRPGCPDPTEPHLGMPFEVVDALERLRPCDLAPGDLAVWLASVPKVQECAVMVLQWALSLSNGHSDTGPRSWSLPAPPPEDVTVVHVEGDERARSWRRSGATHWLPVRPDGGAPVSWPDLLDRGTVVEGGFPVPPPKFKRGFYRLTRDLEVGPDIVAGGSLVFLASVETPSREHGSVHAESALARVKLADLAAAGAERVEDHR